MFAMLGLAKRILLGIRDCAILHDSFHELQWKDWQILAGVNNSLAELDMQHC